MELMANVIPCVAFVFLKHIVPDLIAGNTLVLTAFLATEDRMFPSKPGRGEPADAIGHSIAFHMPMTDRMAALGPAVVLSCIVINPVD